MTGLVLVAHTASLAAAAADLARVVAGSDTRVVPAQQGDPAATGVDPTAIRAAIANADTGTGVVVLTDLGSSVLTAKVVAAEIAEERSVADVRLADAPFVEGAVAAAVTASTGQGIDAVVAAAEAGWDMRKL
ncbi:MAG TPA: hypothetical protein VK053_13165 [Jiangellaceae bacterium]|nr:hypothetical protein [Jiangellaceae bacterium]